MADTQISAVCEQCGQAIEGGNSVPLWDGFRHCRSCLEQIAPELVDHARSHDRLVEAWPFADERFPRRWRYAATMMGIVCTVAVASSTVLGGPYAIVSMVSFSIFYVYFNAFAWWTARSQPTVVAVRDGVVEVQTRYVTVRRRLADCRWTIGQLPRSWELPTDRNYVLLDFRMTCCGIPIERHLVPCGFSEQSQRLWTSFLTEARVRSGRPPLPMAWVYAAFFLLVTAMFAAVQIARVLPGGYVGLAVFFLVWTLAFAYVCMQSSARLGRRRAALAVALPFPMMGGLVAAFVGAKSSLGLAALATIPGAFAALGLVVAWDVSRRLARANRVPAGPG